MASDSSSPISGWRGSRYPAVAGNDIARGLYLTSLGRIAHPASSAYPTPGHPPEFQFSWHTGRTLGDFALVWVERGRGTVETPLLGRANMEPGSVLLLPPGVWHRYKPDPETGWVERWVCANGSYLHRLRTNGVFPSTPEIRPICDRNALDVAFDQLQARSEGNCLWVSGLTLSAVALALGEIEKSPDGVSGNDSSGDPLVDASIHFIRTNCHRAVGVDDIAKHAGISRRMLERRFARTWLRSVAQELTLARVRRGRDLLSEKSLTVKEAGYAAGFGSARHFISAHRRIFGTTPGFARHQS